MTTKLSTDKTLIVQLVGDYGSKHVYNHLKYKQKELFQRILNYNKGESISFAEKLYRYINGIQERPVCIQCNREQVKTFYDFYKGYAPFCSRKCATKNKAVADKRKRTLKIKHGVESPVEVRWSK